MNACLVLVWTKLGKYHTVNLDVSIYVFTGHREPIQHRTHRRKQIYSSHWNVRSKEPGTTSNALFDIYQVRGNRHNRCHEHRILLWLVYQWLLQSSIYQIHVGPFTCRNWVLRKLVKWLLWLHVPFYK